MSRRSVVRFAVAALALCAAPALAGAATMSVTSSAFSQGGRIPQQYAAAACDGRNLSLPLKWSGAPGLTQSIALSVYDPDAGGGAGFWHWVVYDLPRVTRALTSSKDGSRLPHGTVVARNSAGTRAWFGPCPPHGAPHHYRFTVYALDVPYAQMKPGSAPGAILGTISSHVLAAGTLTGIYGR